MADQTNIYVGVAGYFGKPDHPGRVGIFRRAGIGGDWRHVLGTVQAFTVFIHPGDPATVLAGTNDGIWRSTDAGASFRRTDFPDTRTEVWSFLVDSREPKRILAGFADRHVSQRRRWRELAQAARPGHAHPLHRAFRLPGHAPGPASAAT